MEDFCKEEESKERPQSAGTSAESTLSYDTWAFADVSDSRAVNGVAMRGQNKVTTVEGDLSHSEV